MTIICGDCLEEMRKMDDNSISAIVTDPPYGLGFMGKHWDAGLPQHEIWSEALRIVKPGGHLLAFGGTRTYHRLTCAIEDAGWDIRDCLMWLYGSGFPKSHNRFGIEGYGTALKPAHEPIIVGQKPYEITQFIAIISYDLTNEIHRNICQKSNVLVSDAEKNLKDSLALLNKALPFTVQENVIMYAWEKFADANYVAKNTIEPELGSVSANLSFVPEDASTNGCSENPLESLILHGGAEIIFANIQDIYMSVITNDTSENIALLWRNTLEDILREVSKFTTRMVLRLITELRTLKSCLSPIISNDTGNLFPNYEPIIMAMKKCDGTFKQNAEKWEQAGIDIDGCRVPTDELKPYSAGLHRVSPSSYNDDSWKGKDQLKEAPKGRWPANVILDEEAGEMLDEQSGVLKSGSMSPQLHQKKNSVYSKWNQASPTGQEASSGGASRFFYCAKASSSERNEGTGKNNHPTVKPLKLMEYLIKLIMPPKDGILLDPFAGSGTTILAAHRLGMKAIGIEKQQEYCDIANARLANHITNNLKCS